MSDNFGLKVSLPGFDVESAADQDLYLSSSWPLLKIDDVLTQQIINLNPSNNLITHNLGYPPFTLVFSHQNGFQGAASSVNSTTITPVSNNYATHVSGDSLQVYVCRNPLNINFQAPNINLSGSGANAPAGNFGVKFSKPGKDITSTDYRDFTLHSSTKSLQVHQVIYQSLSEFNDINFGLPNNPANQGIKYITDLPYTPVYFAFFSSDNVNFVPIFAASQTTPKIEYNPIDGGIIIYNSTSPGWGVFYVLLDPFQSTNQVNVAL